MLSMYFFTAFIGTFFQCGTSDQLSVPLVVVTWDFKESLDAGLYEIEITFSLNKTTIFLQPGPRFMTTKKVP